MFARNNVHLHDIQEALVFTLVLTQKQIPNVVKPRILELNFRKETAEVTQTKSLMSAKSTAYVKP